MSFLQEDVYIERDLGVENSLAVVEGEITLPQGRQDIINVLGVSGKTKIDYKEGDLGRIAIGGSVCFNIMYNCEGGINSYESAAPFTHSINIDGFEPGMDFEVCLNLDEIKYNLLDPRRVMVKGDVHVMVRLCDKQVVKPIVRNLDDLEVKSFEMKMPCVPQKCNHDFSLREDVRIPQGLPPMDLILKDETCVKIKNIMKDGNKAIVDGELKVVTTYKAVDDVPIWQTSNTIRFEEMVEMDTDITNMNVECRPCVKDVIITIVEDTQGLINIEANIKLMVTANCDKEVTFVKDAYSSVCKVKCKSRRIDVKNVTCIDDGKHAMRETVAVKNGTVSKVLTAFGQPCVTTAFIAGGKVSIDGKINCTVCYINKEGNVSSFKDMVPYTAQIDVDQDLCGDVMATVFIEQMSATGAGEEIDIRANLCFEIKVFNQKAYNVVDEIEDMGDLEDSRTPFMVYLPAEDEGIWDVAKKFCVSTKSVLDNNQIINENDLCGTKLMLFNPLES